MRRIQCETNNFETEYNYKIEVTKLTGAMRKSVEDDARNQYAPRHSQISTREAYGEAKLETIVGPEGCDYRPTTAKQR